MHNYAKTLVIFHFFYLIDYRFQALKLKRKNNSPIFSID